MRSVKNESKIVIFEVGSFNCALPLDQVFEILPLTELACPPSSPTILEGFLNVGGDLIPVVNLELLFGLSISPERVHSHFLVVRNNGTRLALKTNYVSNIVEAPEKERAPVTSQHSFNDCVESEVRNGNSPVFLLNLSRLLLIEERTRIEHLQGVEEKRIHDLEKEKSC